MDRDELIEVEINKREIKVNIFSHLDQTNSFHKGFMYELCKATRTATATKTSLNTRTYTKSYPRRGTRGGGVGGTPLSFSYVRVFRNGFAFSGKPLICSTRLGIFYEWRRCWRSVTSPNMVAILDFIKN